MTCSTDNASGTRSGSSPAGNDSCKAGVSAWLAGVLVIMLLLGAGVVYRVAASGLQRIRDNPVVLPVPLGAIPTVMSPWIGRDMDLPSTTRKYMTDNFADYYVSRRYTNAAEGAWADVYVVYCSTYPSGLLGHKPDVCFPAHGWIHDQTVETEITTRSGRMIPCLRHLFHRSPPQYGQVFVLSFYVLNGQVTLRERDFSGFLDRTPNISGNPARYVAQVQISSAFEPSAIAAARDLVDTILTFLPDRHGYVQATGADR